MTTKAAPAPKTLKPCRCTAFEVGEFDVEQEGYVGTTGCLQFTNRIFAQGHDAKLVSHLVRAELDGYEIRTVGDGLTVTFPGAEAAARTVSEPLATKARNMLAKAKEKADARAKRAADKEAKKAASGVQKQAANQTTPVKGKVGRWEVEGTVDGEGRLSYTTKSGEAKTAEAGKWTRVA